MFGRAKKDWDKIRQKNRFLWAGRHYRRRSLLGYTLPEAFGYVREKHADLNRRRSVMGIELPKIFGLSARLKPGVDAYGYSMAVGYNIDKRHGFNKAAMGEADYLKARREVAYRHRRSTGHPMIKDIYYKRPAMNNYGWLPDNRKTKGELEEYYKDRPLRFLFDRKRYSMEMLKPEFHHSNLRFKKFWTKVGYEILPCEIFM